MATTESRPGFRLPWSSDHRTQSDRPPAAGAADEATTETAAAASPDAAGASVDSGADAEQAGTQPVGSQADEPEDDVTPTASSSVANADHAPGGTAEAVAPSSRPNRPSKFLADLTKAMQTAAEAERDETLTQYRSEVKAFVEQIHAESSERATEYRKRSDEDVAAIREWSKGEMARIREETDRRITARKADLDVQLERHGARVEREIERVEGRVGAYEAEMARFFERLLAVDDPTRFAGMAASLPEPPPFTVDLDAEDPAPIESPAPPASSLVEDLLPPIVEQSTPAQHEAIPAEGAEPEPVAPDPDQNATGFDPRISALGLTPDFAAAEAEAMLDAASDPGEPGDGDQAVVEEAVAARLANLVPGPTEPAHTGAIATTQVVVVGLVSVASIAGFKRHLARVPGVQSVGVSSGPDGEFVFTAVHHDDVAMREIVPTLPGFKARVSNAGDGVVHVTAHDPESDG